MQAKSQNLLNRKSRLRQAQYGLLLLALCAGNLSTVQAQAGVESETESEYLTTRTIVLEDGTSLEEVIINGPPTPPPGYEAERASVVVPEPSEATKTLTAPAYKWVFGCSSVSGAMIAGYYDRNGFANMYTGPTAGGVMPLDDTAWPAWSDGHNTYPNNPLIASHNGVDGRVSRGSIDDYWIQYGSAAEDPFITNGWTEHTWSTAIGDYMKTSQSSYGNTDGSTTFYNYDNSPDQLTCADMVTNGIQNLDGTYGRKLFYEARGYTVTDCYSQKTDNTVSGGFSYAQYKAQIDANRPVMINLAGHTVAGVGYNDPSTIYIHDTWDDLNHEMTWGGSYAGMEMQSVSIVNLTGGTPPCTGFNSQFNGSTAGWAKAKGTWTNYLSRYYRSTGIANKFASAKRTGTASYGNFTYEVKMKRTGIANLSNSIILRGNSGRFNSIYNWQPSYIFEYVNEGYFSVWEISSSGTETALKPWTTSSYIVKNGWNTLKVTANGSSLKFFINGHLVWSGSDSTLKSGKVGFSFYRDSAAGRLDVDWAKLTCLKAGTLADLSEEVEAGVELTGGDITQSP